MINERTLKKWRSEALTKTGFECISDGSQITMSLGRLDELNKRILRMTQELLDQYLIRRN